MKAIVNVLLGGYYSYDTKTIKEPVTVNCGNQTDAQGHLRCQFNLPKQVSWS